MSTNAPARQHQQPPFSPCRVKELDIAALCATIKVHIRIARGLGPTRKQNEAAPQGAASNCINAVRPK